MRRYLLVIAACCAALSAQPQSSDLTCVVTIGEIAYPPYQWGFHGSGVARIVTQLGPDARPVAAEPVDANEFGREAQRSVLASTYDQACQGRKLVLTYRFQLAGDGTDTRDVALRKEQDRIVVTARPATPLCNSRIQTDDDAAAHTGRADALLNHRKYPEALECAEQALRWRPIESAYIAKGVALRKLGRLRDAITAYDELEKIAPRHSQLFFNRANAYRDFGDKEAAIRDFTRAIEVTDEPEKVFLNRGNIYLSLRRFELARNDYQKAAELDPSDSKAQNSLCTLLTEVSMHQEAMTACNRAIELNPDDAGAYNNRAILWNLEKKYSEAIRDASTAILIEPRDFASHFTRGEAHALAGNFKESLTDLNEAIRLLPDSGEAHDVRANVRRALGDITGATADEQIASRLGLTPGMMRFVFDPVTGISKPIK